jgi:hypothetical protein
MKTLRLFAFLFCVYICLLASAFAEEYDRSPVVSETQLPVEVINLGDGSWYIDFYEDAFGNVEITAPEGSNGAKITVQMGEMADGPEIVRSENENIRYQSHEVTLVEGKSVSPELTWAPPSFLKDGWITHPKGAGEIMPFRYVRIDNAPKNFDETYVQRKIYHVPFNEEASMFYSSNEDLNKVWEFCKYSIKATSAFGVYVDGDRERKPYEADALINQLSHYCVDADYQTARYTMEYLLDHPTWPTEWQFHMVMMAWNDYMWSGDDSFIRKHYETLKERAMLSRRTPNDLFQGVPFDWSAPIRDIVDWPDVERDGYDMKVVTNTVVTAYYYHSLILLQKMAEHLGKTDEAEKFSHLAKATYKAFNEKLWDEERGVYIDGLDADGNPSTHSASHANFFPLAFDLVPQEYIPRVVDYIKSKGMVCSVYGAQFLLEALFKAGEGDYAMGLMTSRDTRSWLNMMEKVGSSITMEAWDPSLKPNLDWNHAWGAAPANIIPRYVAGIEPLEPGFKRFRVNPQSAGLAFSYRLPVPQGSINLSIKKASRDFSEIILNVPEGAEAEYSLPGSREISIWGMSEKLMEFKTAEEGFSVNLKSGDYKIVIR